MASNGEIFSKAMFSKNAPSNVKRVLSRHLDTIDGKKVDSEGKIDYEIDGEEFYLYPVSKDWCEEAIKK